MSKLKDYKEYQLSLNLGENLKPKEEIEKDLLDRLIDSNQFETPTMILYIDLIRHVAGSKFKTNEVVEALGHFTSAEWLEFLFVDKIK